MKTDLPIKVAVAVAGVALGFLLGMKAAGGRGDAGEGDGRGRPATAVTTGADGGKSREDKSSHPGRQGHSLAALEYRLRKQGTGPDYAAYLERLSMAELRETMAEVVEAAHGATESRPGLLRVARAAARELFRRDDVAALEWAGGLKREERRAVILTQLIFAALEESPELAKPWVDRFQKEMGYPPGGHSAFIEEALKAASGKGVDAILTVRDVFGGNLAGYKLTDGPLPQDFDFKRLLTEFKQNGGALGEPIHLWAARDPDAAWAALRELEKGQGEMVCQYFSSLFDGMSQTAGENEAARWIGGKLGELPANLRQQALFSMMDTHDGRYQVVNAVMDNLPTDADRVAMAMGTVSPMGGDAPLDILRHLGTASLQADALVGAAKSYSRVASDPEHQDSKMVNGYFTKIIADLNLPPAERERVMETLRTPQDPFSR